MRRPLWHIFQWTRFIGQEVKNTFTYEQNMREVSSYWHFIGISLSVCFFSTFTVKCTNIFFSQVCNLHATLRLPGVSGSLLWGVCASQVQSHCVSVAQLEIQWWWKSSLIFYTFFKWQYGWSRWFFFHNKKQKFKKTKKNKQLWYCFSLFVLSNILHWFLKDKGEAGEQQRPWVPK